ncbi:MAG: ATP/GTP-binding protein [Chloroflexota bacterium]
MTEPPEIQTVKIVVTGPFSSGKTSLIQSISEIDVVSTEGVTAESKTTIAMDFGRLTVQDDDLYLYLFGTPGARRFDWDFLSNPLMQEGFPGIIFVVDSARPETFREARAILNQILIHTDVLFVIAANKQDKPGAWSHRDVGVWLLRGHAEHVPVLPCVATDPVAARRVLLELCYEALRQMDGE